MHEKLRDIIATLDDLTKKLAKQEGRSVATPPRGATEAEIASTEQAIGHPFPAELRAFLALRNGWPSFGGGIDLFGLEDYRNQRHRDWMLMAAGVPDDEEIFAELDAAETGEGQEEEDMVETSGSETFVMAYAEEEDRIYLHTPGGSIVDMYVEEDNIKPMVEEFYDSLADLLAAEAARLKDELA